MQYNIEELSSVLYSVKLYSRDWNFIINKFIPYFYKLYGNKNKGLKRLDWIGLDWIGKIIFIIIWWI